MKDHQSIPEISFQNRDKKTFEFEIIGNRELLLNRERAGHNPFRPHRIHFYAILFIMEGAGNHFIDFKRYQYQGGSIIFISKDQVQRFEKNLEREAYFLIFTEAFLERSGRGSDLMQLLSLYNYQLYHPVLQLNEQQMKSFQELVLRIKQEYDSAADPFTEEIIQSTLRILLFNAQRIRKQHPAAQLNHRYLQTFLKFQKLLQQQLLSNRQVSYYANEMGISTKKVNRVTQEIIGKTAKNYIHELLILEMKRLLMNTSLSVKEIAFKSGFEEPTNFVKYFKKIAGMTPKKFRVSYSQENG